MNSHPCLILVVEDDSSQQELMLIALQRIGVTEPVRCVHSGQDAIAYLQGDGVYADRGQFPYPTLIITDLQMSAGDGYALLRHLRDQPNKQSCPVAVFSSLDDDAHIVKAKQLGASNYIVKPTTFADTCRALRVLFPQEGGSASATDSLHRRCAGSTFPRSSKCTVSADTKRAPPRSRPTKK